jgi:hypothetical protein
MHRVSSLQIKWLSRWRGLFPRREPRQTMSFFGKERVILSCSGAITILNAVGILNDEPSRSKSPACSPAQETA